MIENINRKGRHFYLDGESLKLLEEFSGCRIETSKTLNTVIKMLCGALLFKKRLS